MKKDVLQKTNKINLLLLFIFILVFSNVYLLADVPDIKVGLNTNQNQARFFSQSGFIINYSESRKENILDKTVNVRRAGSNFQINNRNYSGRKIILTPRNKKHLIEYNNLRYRGSIKLIFSDRGFNVINKVNLEHYVYGVLANEMLRTAPEEALKTLSIVVRTYGLKNKDRHSGQNFDVCNTTHCQVYRGYNTECDIIREAVDSTRGIVIKYNGELISAYHHSACGGGTANNEDVWNGSPIEYLRGRWCDFCSHSPRSSWSFDLKLSELENKLDGVNIGKIKRVGVSESDSFGRAKEIKITGKSGEYLMQANRFRLLVGSMKMWNTMFSLKGYGGNSAATSKRIDKLGNILETERSDFIKNIILESEERQENIHYDGYTIDGSGSGHGVGLCQWGSKGLAEKGLTFREIIPFYYSGVEIVRIY
ncbi:MAG: SpoIID/LytB domain-containing protein [Candidatus Muiribacteriota bacterium]